MTKKCDAPAFQFYAAEWLADENVALMTCEEEGAYIRLLAYCWREGSIPSSPEAAARLCKHCSTTVAEVVLQRFTLKPKDETRMIHDRLEKERKKQAEWRRKSSAGGKASAKSKSEKKNGSEPQVNHPSTTLEQMVQPKVNSSSLSLSSSSSSKEYKEIHTPHARGVVNQAEAERVAFRCGPSEAFNRFMAAYPLGKSPGDAWVAWQGEVAKLVMERGIPDAEAEEILIAAAIEFRASPSGGDPMDPPHDFRVPPAKFLREGRYLEDRKEWLRPNAKVSRLKSTPQLDPEGPVVKKRWKIPPIPDPKPKPVPATVEPADVGDQLVGMVKSTPPPKPHLTREEQIAALKRMESSGAMS